MASLFAADGLLALVALTAMEIVLGIDNVVFIAILTARLPAPQQAPARRIGLAMALLTRIALLFAISWIMGLNTPLFTLLGYTVTGRRLILLGGGLFLIGKATREIYDKLETTPAGGAAAARAATFWLAIGQILLLDIVFSLDSVITAVGMANQLAIMVIAMVLAMLMMLVSLGPISGFVERHPSVKILALAFLLLIGVMLVAEGMGTHVDKGYIYFAMAFSLLVELLNMRYRRKHARAEPRPRAA